MHPTCGVFIRPLGERDEPRLHGKDKRSLGESPRLGGDQSGVDGHRRSLGKERLLVLNAEPDTACLLGAKLRAEGWLDSIVKRRVVRATHVKAWQRQRGFLDSCSPSPYRVRLCTA